MNRGRWIALIAVMAALTLLSSPSRAQRRGRPMATTRTSWSYFALVAGNPPSRGTLPDIVAGTLALAGAEWTCSYGPATRTALDRSNWSELRTLECRRGDSVVATSGFCQVSGRSWLGRAATLTLSSASAPSPLQVTLDCSVLD